jgi:hypothetical protein
MHRLLAEALVVEFGQQVDVTFEAQAVRSG